MSEKQRDLNPVEAVVSGLGGDGSSNDYLSFELAGQLFGLPVLQVQDVLAETEITRIPLAPSEVAGALNLRGRIVTAIDVRRRLGVEERGESGRTMSIVVDHGGELYSLVVDEVGEVLRLQAEDFARNPPTLEPAFREVSAGIYRLKGRLLVVLDVRRLLGEDAAQAA